MKLGFLKKVVSFGSFVDQMQILHCALIVVLLFFNIPQGKRCSPFHPLLLEWGVLDWKSSAENFNIFLHLGVDRTRVPTHFKLFCFSAWMCILLKQIALTRTLLSIARITSSEPLLSVTSISVAPSVAGEVLRRPLQTLQAGNKDSFLILVCFQQLSLVSSAILSSDVKGESFSLLVLGLAGTNRNKGHNQQRQADCCFFFFKYSRFVGKGLVAGGEVCGWCWVCLHVTISGSQSSCDMQKVAMLHVRTSCRFVAASGLYCYVCSRQSDNSLCSGKQHIVNCSDVSTPTSNFDACHVSVTYSGQYSYQSSRAQPSGFCPYFSLEDTVAHSRLHHSSLGLNIWESAGESPGYPSSDLFCFLLCVGGSF